ncbi:MAG: NUDIX hydrolase [Bacteroidota bacterium]
MTLRRWKQTDSRTVIKTGYWDYKLDRFIRDGDNYEGEYHYVHTPGSTMIIPVTGNGKLLLVNQFRYLNRRESLEFPCGSIHEGLNETDNALKELREETGFSASDIRKTGEFSPYTGASDEMCSVFIARGLVHSPLPMDKTEEFELVELSPAELSALIERNIIWDGLTLSAWALANKYFL